MIEEKELREWRDLCDEATEGPWLRRRVKGAFAWALRWLRYIPWRLGLTTHGLPCHDRRSMSCPCYTPSGDIDIEKTLWVLKHSHRPDLDLIETLRALWADAYAHGWSDGQSGEDPNARGNPYST